MKFVLKDIFKDLRGRFVIVRGSAENKVVTLASVYAPNLGQLEFMEDVLEKLDSLREGTLILGGYLTYVMDLVWNRSSHDRKWGTATDSKTGLSHLIL